MLSQPVSVTIPSTETATAARRTLFRVALSVAMVGSVIVSTILFLHAGLALGHLRYFVDIGHHPLHITSALLLGLALLSIVAFSILTIGLINMNRPYVLIAAGLLVFCSLSLIIFSIWSFATISSGLLPRSINSTLAKELDQTQYNIAAGNHITVDNTLKMARLEKQHQCCGLSDPVEDYRSRQPSFFGAPSSPSSSGGQTRGKVTNAQRNPSHSGPAPLLPISCCNEKFRFEQCRDVYGNNTNPLNLYNMNGCYAVIAREKFDRIQQQGFITIVAGALAVISSIALAALIKLLAEGHRIVPLRIAT